MFMFIQGKQKGSKVKVKQGKVSAGKEEMREWIGVSRLLFGNSDHSW